MIPWDYCDPIAGPGISPIKLTSAINPDCPDSSMEPFYPPADQLGAGCKFTEGALYLLMQIVDKDILKTLPSTKTWGTPLVTSSQLDLTPFTTTLWAGPSRQVFTQKTAPIQAVSSQFLQENAMGNNETLPSN
ncbi:hypothetical protein HGM15179_010362 [Zosterops borbonicus]|uniref:Uncharacterized protein n=1 Tax=Zosterops borbonicus TaxID=364589 RepID=A0A8K1LKA4_9PASS|nr:hypothetical protein HGM15179_010362 [Zosterops borbonicus]